MYYISIYPNNLLSVCFSITSDNKMFIYVKITIPNFIII